MMKPILRLILLLVVPCTTQIASARLGEDEAQCEERYGFAKKNFEANDRTFPLVNGDRAKTRTYLYQGWRIRVGFLDGVAVREEYRKEPGTNVSLTIADYESKAILEGEKVSNPWQPKTTRLSFNVPKMLAEHLQQTLTGQTWVRGDGQATATLDSYPIRLSLESLAIIQYEAAVKQVRAEQQCAAVPTF